MMRALPALILFLLWSVPAAAQIRSPGSHPRYGVELEPHLVVQWAYEPYWDDEGIGIGLRASIPVIDNGPVRTINNSLAVSFGMDWAHFGDCGGWADSCDADNFWFPVALQWNFWISKVVSLFPELGLALQYSILDWNVRLPRECVRVDGRDICTDGDYDDIDLRLILFFGARFALNDNIAITVRLGVPSLLLGVSIFM